MNEATQGGNHMLGGEHVCVGSNTDLEKEYLRLTGVSCVVFHFHGTCKHFDSIFLCLCWKLKPPEADKIRPLDVLHRSLEHVLRKYEKTKDYRYICDQLKAIRQDMTVIFHFRNVSLGAYNIE